MECFIIFVMAWCCIFATFLSRETLAVIIQQNFKKKNMKFNYSLFFFFITFFGYSQNWTYVGKDKIKNEYYFKSTYVSKEGINNDIIKIWTKKIYKTFTDKSKGKSITYNDAYFIELVLFDCSNNKYKLLSTTAYNSNGVMIYDRAFSEYTQDWEYAVPDSVGDKVLSTICNTFN